MCPTCHTTLDQSDSPIAQRIKRVHQGAHRRGRHEEPDQGEARRAVREAVLGAPPKNGFDLLAWLLPSSALGAGALVLGAARVALEPRRASRAQPRRGRRSIPSSSARVDEGLARFDRSEMAEQDPGRVPRRARLGRSRRACSRSCRAISRRSPRSRRRGSASAGRAARRAREPAVHPRLHGRLRRARRRGGRDRRRRLAATQTESRASSSSSSASPSSACCRGRSGRRAGLLDARAARLERSPRRRLRRLRRAVHRHRPRVDLVLASDTGRSLRGSVLLAAYSARPRRSPSSPPGSRFARAMGAFRWLRDHYTAIQRRQRR